MSHIQQLRKYIKARMSTGMNVEAGAIVCFTERDRVEILELDIPRSRSPYFKLSRSEVDVPDPMEAS
jgi:hypothetical protein